MYKRDLLTISFNYLSLVVCFVFFLSFSDNLSLDDIQSQLVSAWLDLNHFPPPTIHTVLCSLLALTMGQQNPVTTAMLHAQSLGITSRHRTIRHLASSLRQEGYTLPV